MAALFISALLMLAAKLCENIFQLMMNMFIPQLKVFLVFWQESVLGNIDPAFVDNNLACRHSFRQNFLRHFFVFNSQEC
jgi:hypothetical protein